MDHMSSIKAVDRGTASSANAAHQKGAGCSCDERVVILDVVRFIQDKPSPADAAHMATRIWLTRVLL